MKKTFFFTVICFLLTVQSIAQQYGNFEKVPFAIGIFPPLSTNGKHAGNCVNQASINLLAGYSAGLSGVEISAFSNSDRDFAHGIQIAGFGNFVGGEFAGFQFGSFANFNKGISNGFQFAGFANYNYSQADGVLAAGFFNFTRGKSFALQLAGFGNYCQDAEGIQAAGFSNVVKGDGKVTQMAGVANITKGNVYGIQIAGAINYSKEKMQNLQVAGVLNFAGKEAEGSQVAGAVNITHENMTGAQIAGCLNMTKNLNGTQISAGLNIAKIVTGCQIGILNISDTIKSGIPIGFLSIVKKNGFHEMEFSVSEGWNTQATYKIGVEKFYNIFTIGAKVFGPRYCWGTGYGLGTQIFNNENFKSQLELISYHVNEGEAWTDGQNEMEQLRVIFSKKLNSQLRLFVSPTCNLILSKTKENDHPFSSCFAPYSLYTHSGHCTKQQAWIGLTVGVQL